jgi:hypothetical protein
MPCACLLAWALGMLTLVLNRSRLVNLLGRRLGLLPLPGLPCPYP